MKRPYVTNTKAWKRFEKDLYNYPPFRVMPEIETPHEKKMAKLMQKLIDYQYTQAMGSVILKTPFGVLMWSPKV